MIYARHTRLAQLIFVPFLRYLFRKHVQDVTILGELPLVPQNTPLVLAPNHSLWWDGFIVYMLNHYHFKRPFHVMMLEEQLRRYWFFQHVGAYSIRQESPRSILESLRYTQKIFSQTPEALITIFPQGEQLPSRTRPLKCKRGIESLIRSSQNDIAVLPIGIRMEHINDPLPNIIINIGRVRITSQSAPYPTDELEHDITYLLDEIDRAILQKEIMTSIDW